MTKSNPVFSVFGYRADDGELAIRITQDATPDEMMTFFSILSSALIQKLALELGPKNPVELGSAVGSVFAGLHQSALCGVLESVLRKMPKDDQLAFAKGVSAALEASGEMWKTFMFFSNIPDDARPQ